MLLNHSLCLTVVVRGGYVKNHSLCLTVVVRGGCEKPWSFQCGVWVVHTCTHAPHVSLCTSASVRGVGWEEGRVMDPHQGPVSQTDSTLYVCEATTVVAHEIHHCAQ